MKKLTVTGLLCIACTAFAASCSKKSSTDTGSGGSSCTGVSAKFTADVQPILTTVCSINSNCHASGSTNSGGPFTNHAQVAAKAANIKTAISNGTMPQGTSLSQAQKSAFICWIDSGAPNN